MVRPFRSGQVCRIDANIAAHLAKQTLADLFLEILDGRATAPK
jgi:hypothetical protein